MPPSLICLCILAVIVLGAYGRDYITGICVSVAILISASEGIRIDLPGDLPPITIHRVILLIWYFHYIRNGRLQTTGRTRAPMLSLLILLLCSKLVSACFSTHPAHSLKDCLGILLEQLLFYNLVFRSINGFPNAVRVVKAACVGLGFVGVLAFFEYYTGVNIAAKIDPTIPVSLEEGIDGTFRHRILLGYAMAMIIPPSIVLAQTYTLGSKKRLYQVACLFSVAVCYFTNSRGPWLGAGISLIVLGCLGSKKVRKLLLAALAISVCVLILRPGVRSTISDLMLSTPDPETYRGSSYAYRKELWGVAYGEITKSPIRTLFGYGGLSTEFMNLFDKFQYGGNIFRTGFSSWDNQYAANLIEFGFLGFTIEALVYLSLLRKLWYDLQKSPPAENDFRTALMASAIIYLWALTNVWMFSIQIKFLFWSLVGVSFALSESTNYVQIEANKAKKGSGATNPHSLKKLGGLT